MGSSAKNNVMVLIVMMVLFVHGGTWAEAQVHHVVGDDRGWDLASNIASWADGRTFTVGDFLWFAYSGGLDRDNVVELRSKEEFESCDVSNPIVMLTEGIDKISLQEEGHRYFASSNIDNCKKGLKLPVEVQSKSSALRSSSSTTNKAAFLAQEPSAPSSATQIYGSVVMVVFCVVALFTVAY
ncbi:hypothetical protein RND81_07G117500 [Saponaria officinalis]|uniref:Phytocyanin domain-containing protein n=1 Tax=Saponaria officinalis TaxID=3572 RepID=A0AAW1JRA0_SAPOF